jgi:hypothetical protein
MTSLACDQFDAVTPLEVDQSGYYRHLLTTDKCLAGCTLSIFAMQW